MSNTRLERPHERSERIVFVVDGDEASRALLCELIGSMGLPTRAFESAEEFLAAYEPDWRGCLVTDVRMLGMSGLELLEVVRARELHLPAIVVTAYARTPLTVRALKRGAVTVLEKPCGDDELWEAIREALAQEAREYAEHQRRHRTRECLARLTPDERRVMQRIVDGTPNKIIARAEGVSLRTVESRRRAIFAKMGASSLAALVRMAIETGTLPPG